MGKRRNEDYSEEPESDERSQDSDEMQEGSEKEVNVDFEFFDPKEIDFHNIKSFMNNLFGPDFIDTSDLANIIIEQPLIGTTIKNEGEDDAYAIFTIINMNVHHNRKSIEQIREYILSNTKNDPKLHEKLNSLLNPNSNQHVGLLLNERLINMPIQVAPPMYKMLGEEIEWAINDKEPYNFEYIILLSKTYHEVEPEVNGEIGREVQNNKRSKGQPSTGTFYVNMEDELIARYAEAQHSLDFQPLAVPDAKRTFSEYGVLPSRKFFLIHHSNYQQIVKTLEEAIPTPSQ